MQQKLNTKKGVVLLVQLQNKGRHNAENFQKLPEQACMQEIDYMGLVQ
jgi:hypothetical protein